MTDPTDPAEPTEPTDPADPAAGARGTAADGAPTRQCGRCRRRFPIPAGTHAMELRDWWACPNCNDSLVPGRQRTSASRTEQHGDPT